MRNDGAQVIQPGSIAGGRRNLRILVDVLGFAVPVGAAEYQPGHPLAFERLECSVRSDLQFIVGHQLQAVVGVLGLKCECHAVAESRRAERDLPVIGVWLDTGCAISGPKLPVRKPGLLVGHELRRTEINGPPREGGGFVGGPECAAVIGAHTAGNTEEVPPIDGLVDQYAVGDGLLVIISGCLGGCIAYRGRGIGRKTDPYCIKLSFGVFAIIVGDLRCVL